MKEFTPKTVMFCCNWCTYAGADLAGVSRLKINPNFRVIRTMCSGRVDPQLVLGAFFKGADGVMIGGCHPGDCHYISGNYKALRRVLLLKKLVSELGINQERLHLEWISASEGGKFARVVNEFIQKIKSLGPLELNQKDIQDRLSGDKL
ncbi:MAG: hydrogenase iron-sulfur subunit [bacterium]